MEKKVCCFAMFQATAINLRVDDAPRIGNTGYCYTVYKCASSTVKSGKTFEQMTTMSSRPTKVTLDRRR